MIKRLISQGLVTQASVVCVPRTFLCIRSFRVRPLPLIFSFYLPTRHFPLRISRFQTIITAINGAWDAPYARLNTYV